MRAALAGLGGEGEPWGVLFPQKGSPSPPNSLNPAYSRSPESFHLLDVLSPRPERHTSSAASLSSVGATDGLPRREIRARDDASVDSRKTRVHGFVGR